MSYEVFDRIHDAYGLSADEAELVRLVQDVVRDKIGPGAEETDRTGKFPHENLAILDGLGLSAAFLPRECGGDELSYRCYVRIVAELARGCSSTAISWAATTHALTPIRRFATGKLRQHYLAAAAAGAKAALAITESSGGSDLRSMGTKLTAIGDEILVEGEKVFITNADVADFCVVFGNWKEPLAGRTQLSAVVIDHNTPGIEVVRVEDKMGHRGSSTVAVRFDGCRVARENLLVAPGAGFEILLATLAWSRPSIAAEALGIARAAFDEVVAYANERSMFGGPQIQLGAVEAKVADLAIGLAQAECWLCHVATMIDHGVTDFETEASILKTCASDVALAAAATAVQLHGGEGYIRGVKAERLYRDATLTPIWEGANELQRSRIGRTFGAA